jgi:hypothetical protein
MMMSALNALKASPIIAAVVCPMSVLRYSRCPASASLDIRPQFPALFPQPNDSMVVQRNEITHQYEHGVKPEVQWDHVWETIENVYPTLRQDLIEAIEACKPKKSK